MYLFFDVETNGLPRRCYQGPLKNQVVQPRVVQLAFSRYSEEGEEISSYSRIIYPEDFEIPLNVVRVHGITKKRALMEGLPGNEVFASFNAEAKKSECLVAHNFSFDYPVVCAELFRYGLKNEISEKTGICTMRPKPVKDFCALPRKNGGYKVPKLFELHEILFGESFDGAHDAGADVRACARCFFELKERGVL